MYFKLRSDYKPTGDQPQAIKALVDGFKKGNQFQTLLGVTGSGKTFTMANAIQALNKPTHVNAHNKTLASPKVSLFKDASVAFSGFAVNCFDRKFLFGAYTEGGC